MKIRYGARIGLALAFSLLLLCGCTGGAEKVEAAKKCVDTYLTALKEKDFETAAACMLPDGTVGVFAPVPYQDPLSQAIVVNLDYTIQTAACADGKAQVQVRISNVDAKSAYYDCVAAAGNAELTSEYSEQIKAGIKSRLAQEDAPRISDDVMILLEYRDGTWYISPDKKLDNMILGGLPTILAETDRSDPGEET